MRKMTFHAQVERFDRITKIVTHFNGDLGSPVAHMFSDSHSQNGIERRYTLYDTGIIIVSDKLDTCVITMFMANIDYATLIWRTNYPFRTLLPNSVYKNVKRNKKFASSLS